MRGLLSPVKGGNEPELRSFQNLLCMRDLVSISLELEVEVRSQH